MLGPWHKKKKKINEKGEKRTARVIEPSLTLLAKEEEMWAIAGAKDLLVLQA